jgi:amino acid adenylation domain-containing protein/thioester reductase-like protein
MYKIKLSPYAKIFYVDWLLEPDSGVYNLVIDQTLYGDLDVVRLKSALKRYIAHHVILNSHIKTIDGEFYWTKNQHIGELEYLDKPLNVEEIYKFVREGFNLNEGPAYRFLLTRLEENVYRLILVFHHIVVDGSSGNEGIFSAISHYYNDETFTAKHSASEQINLASRLSDTLSNTLEQNKDQYKEFWDRHIADIDPIDLKFLKLPLDNLEPNLIDDYRTIDEIRFGYESSDLAKLNHVKYHYVITPYIYAKCIFAFLIHKYTERKQFLVSYGVSLKEGMDIIYGAQVNTNLIPFRFETETTIINLFDDSRAFYDGLKHGELNYSRFPINEIIKGKDKRLLELSFIQPNFKDEPFRFNGITHVEIGNEFNIDAVNPIVFEQEIKNNQINFRVRYNKKILDETLVKNFVAYYQKLFREILEDLIQGEDRKPLAHYQLLDHHHYHKLIDGYNQIKRYQQNETIHELFEEQVSLTPNNIALIHENRQLTYLELNQKANRLGHYLRRNYNIKPDDLVVLCLDKDENMLIAILAVLKAGGAYVPISPNYPDNRIRYILKDTTPKVVLVNDKYRERFKWDHNDVIAIDSAKLKEELVREKETNLATSVTANNLMYLLYTSGTTGDPKGVLQQHNNVNRLFVATNDWFHFNEKDCWLMFHPYTFDFTVWEMWGALLFGGKLVLPTIEQTQDFNQLYQLCLREKITVLNQTPQSFYTFIQSAAKHFQDNRLTHLRYVILGGEALLFANLQPWVNLYGFRQPKLINMYGITETTVHATYKLITDDDISKSSIIGTPIPDQSLFILDSNLKPLPLGAVGELYVGGAGLARGYLNNPILTQQKFINNPFRTEEEKVLNINNRLYKTGDLGRKLPDGSIEYIGRNDLQVKIRGYRIELGEIENKLVGYPGVKQAIVLVKKHVDGSKYLVAYYVANSRLDEVSIQKYLVRQLPHFMLPSTLIYLDKAPLTMNGKLDEGALPEPKFEDDSLYEEPNNKQERLICQDFANILGLKKVGINDDFFKLGGDSLKAINLVSTLQTHFPIKVMDIFNLRTPKRIAESAYYDDTIIKQNLELIEPLPFNGHTPSAISDNREQNKLNQYQVNLNDINIDPTETKPIRNILLTGATGYFGCNILNQLLHLTDYNIFLLIRAATDEEAIDRLNKKYLFYFDRTIEKDLDSRVFVIKADIESPNLGLTEAEYRTLAIEIDSIIHAAALVNHYGEYEKFHSTNVIGTTNLLELARQTNLKDFHYISTTSVLSFDSIVDKINSPGGRYIYTEEYDLSENLSHNQPQNLYISTKAMGEKLVIKYRDKMVKTSIYRVGNLAFMSENFRVQSNAEKNSFFNWLKCIFKLNCIAEGMQHVEISLVDQAAKAIVTLFDKKQLVNQAYHVFNPNLFDLSSIFTHNNKILVKILPAEEFVNKIKFNLDNNIYHDSIIRFLLPQGGLEGLDLKNKGAVEILQDRTQKILGQLGFNWTPITKEVFLKYSSPLNLYGAAEMIKKPKVLEYLEIINPFIPINVYWFDTNNILLGANELTAKSVGVKSIEDYIGKAPHEYFAKEVADNIVKHHQEVVRTGVPRSHEESITDLTTGKIRYFNVMISPLRDDDKKIIGSIGTSFEITAQKEATGLKLEMELQKARLHEQEQFRKIANQVVHDIRSPLAALLVLVKSCEDKLNEHERVALREAAQRIGDIANNLLSRYKGKDLKPAVMESRKPIIISLSLLQLLSEKKHQYKKLPVEFGFDLNPEGSFLSIEAEPMAFNRMMSNIINNAVDALDGRKGLINIQLKSDNKEVSIIISDNGRGMSPEIINKIMNNIPVTAGKKDGNGIGYTQIMDTLKRNNGKITIDSNIGIGTKVRLTFPATETPTWLAKEINLKKGDTVVILDDDESMHRAWDLRFKDFEHCLNIKHFSFGNQAIDFINNFKYKDKIQLLIDFELINQELNGIQIIEKTDIKKVILVTSHHTNLIIRNIASKDRIKILPKPLTSEIPIGIELSNYPEIHNTHHHLNGDGKYCNGVKQHFDSYKKVDFVFVDDDEPLINSLVILFKDRGRNIDTYHSPNNFLTRLSEYPKNTMIFMDNDFNNGMNGLELADFLHNRGYINLYLFSGKDFASHEVPGYLTVISKTETDRLLSFIE